MALFLSYSSTRFAGTYVLYMFLLTAMASPSLSFAQTTEGQQERDTQAFEQMAAYLAQGSGVWRAENEN